jgi:hypothetical protein
VGSRAWAPPSLFTSIFVNTKCSPWGHKDSLTPPLPLQTHTHTNTKTHAFHASHFRLPSCMMNGCAKPNCLLLENVALTSCKEMAHNFTVTLWDKSLSGASLYFFFFFFLFFNYSKLAKFFFLVEKHIVHWKNMFFPIFIHSNKPPSSRLCSPYHSPKWNSTSHT